MKKVLENIFSKLMFNIVKNYIKFHNDDFKFLPQKMEIWKVEELAVNLHDKTEYVIHIRNLKQALNHRLVSKKVNRVKKFNQNAYLKPYIDMNIDLKKKQKLILKNKFSSQ